MPDKTKTVVVIESYEQTIIRRSRRLSSPHLPKEGEFQPLATETSNAAVSSTRWFGVRWLAAALKGVKVFGPASSTLIRGGKAGKKKHS